MNNGAILAIIGLLVGFGGGYFLTGAQSVEPEKHGSHMEDTHMMEGDGHSHHHHEELTVPADAPTPSVALEAFKDTVGGYNVRIEVENFTFAPENVNGDPTPNEGHAHLFVNGTKVARVYGEWFHIDGKHFKDGENMISVTLNANDHSEWILPDNTHIEDSVMVNK